MHDHFQLPTTWAATLRIQGNKVQLQLDLVIKDILHLDPQGFDITTVDNHVILT
jgi:hypothetical protein